MPDLSRVPFDLYVERRMGGHSPKSNNFSRSIAYFFPRPAFAAEERWTTPTRSDEMLCLQTHYKRDNEDRKCSTSSIES